jgi:hypothetical protein
VLTFLTTIRHPARSQSYETVWALLGDTVRSLCAQTDPNFQVVVVCDRAMALSDDPRVHVVTVDWPPVDKNRAHREFKCRSALLDKGTKYAVGLGHLRHLGSDHVMFCDADDFVANDIAAFVNQHPDANGWVMEQGYMLTPKAMTPLDQFNRLCGTSHIIRFNLLNAGIPEHLDQTWPVDLVMAVMDKGFMIHILGNHQQPAGGLPLPGRGLAPGHRGERVEHPQADRVRHAQPARRPRSGRRATGAVHDPRAPHAGPARPVRRLIQCPTPPATTTSTSPSRRPARPPSCGP